MKMESPVKTPSTLTLVANKLLKNEFDDPHFVILKSD